MVGRDGISQLPDDVLFNILSRLTVREVANISTLSRKWNKLCRFINSFNFDWHTMFNSGKSVSRKALPHHPCDKYLDTFIGGVYNLLYFNKSPKISYFRVAFCLGSHDTSNVDNWIRFVVSMGVCKLHIHLSCGNLRLTSSNRSNPNFGTYAFGPQIISEASSEPKIAELSLRSCILGKGLFDKLCCLKRLSLIEVSLQELQVQNILSCCLKLESFQLWKCSLPRKLCITEPALHLRVLEVLDCTELQRIEVFALNLERLDCCCSTNIGIHFLQVQKLESMFLRTLNEVEVFMFHELRENLPSLKTLSLYGKADWVYELPRHVLVATFSKLKQLNLFSPKVSDFDILKLTWILQACPVLGELHIETKSIRGPTNLPFRRVHENLKKVELCGFHHIWDEIEFVVYLIEAAIALEKIIIDPKMRVHDGTGWLVLQTENWNALQRRKIHRLLQDHLKSVVLIVR